ncbi:MAG: hypothetical protein AAFP98_05550 [Pseudomonadota bacterium]
MADFIRPEAKATLWRFRDVIAAISVLALGLWLVLRGFGFVPWIGGAILVFGVVLLIAGIQRARFRQGDDGPGVVQITERRLAYFGPLEGGVMDIADISMLTFDPNGHPAPYWVLTGPEDRSISVPITAKGAESLFDTFALLPGIRTDELLKVLDSPPDQRVVIWSRPRHLLH